MLSTAARQRQQQPLSFGAARASATPFARRPWKDTTNLEIRHTINLNPDSYVSSKAIIDGAQHSRGASATPRPRYPELRDAVARQEVGNFRTVRRPCGTEVGASSRRRQTPGNFRVLVLVLVYLVLCRWTSLGCDTKHAPLLQQSNDF